MFSIIIPVYNESINIGILINEIKSQLKKIKYEVIIVDDSSTDNTLDEVTKHVSATIRVISNESNMGQSFSIDRGIRNSIYNLIVTIDGDGQNNPKDIIKLIKLYNSNIDTFLVGGIRNKRKDTLIKILSSKIANFLRAKILKDNCRDTGCALKVFDKTVYLQFPFFDGIHRFLPALFIGFGYKTLFENVDHRQRRFGKSNYGIRNRLFKGIKDIIKVYKIIKENKKND